MPAMPTPNLYSYCLSLLLVLLAVSKNAWQPAHSELRLHAHRQMCCEDETISYNFLRYQLSWLYASHADPKFVFVLSEPSACAATFCDWAYLAAGPFWVEIACSQADVL